MKRIPLWWVASALSALVLVASLALGLWLAAQAMGESEGASWMLQLTTNAAPLVAVWLLLLLLVTLVWRWIDQRFWREPLRLAETVRLLTAADAPMPHAELESSVAGSFRSLVASVRDLLHQRDQLRSDVQQQVAQASGALQAERNRLAALMAELTQSVVVCNLDGRIILYNNRARLQFRALAGSDAGSAHRIGIGRSIYAVLDRALLVHGLENLQQRLSRGASHPVSQFLTSTPSGQVLRVQMAPVRQSQPQADVAPGQEMDGFVLMLDNVTSSFAQDEARERMLMSLTEGQQSALAGMQSAIEQLAREQDDPQGKERHLVLLREQVQRMSAQITELVARNTQSLKTRWPLEEMPGHDLLVVAQRRIQAQTGCETLIESCEDDVWVKVDSYGLLQALTWLASRLVEEFEVHPLHLRLAALEDKVHLDLVWSGKTMSTETVMSWELDPMHLGEQRHALTVRDVLDRHGGAMWFERERVRHRSFFRLVLPRTQAQEQLDASQVMRNDSRPDYFDFDLFGASARHHDLDDVPLTALTYTVFDTETTGLNPSQGDEIIQIGATRIVNGRLLRSEAYEQLVHPGKRIAAASIPIHGITQDMVEGKPRIGEVLPVFHAYAQDTVLVAHNAAFDMKFLHLKESSTGLRFDQPVLDTLMLSAVIHPNQESHRLEAIAQRMNITVLGRHTALGDAMVTAEVFLRMIPLLADKGIHTLGQAREAAQKTYYASLKY